MKRFAIICEDFSLEHQIKLADYFGEKHYTFWHRMPNCWLLLCPDELSVMELREQIVEVVGIRPNYLVLEVFTWSAFIPPEWMIWFEKNWNATLSDEAKAAIKAMPKIGP